MRKSKIRLLHFVGPYPVSICDKFQKNPSINKGGVASSDKHQCTVSRKFRKFVKNKKCENRKSVCYIL